MKKYLLLFSLLLLVSGAMYAQQYTITTNVNPTGAGTVTGGGTYNYGATCTLTASANYGYHFSQWSDGITQNPRQITVTQDATYTAQFTPNTYIITTNVTPTGAGTVTGGGMYNYGMNCMLAATPNYGYHFSQWSDGVTQNPRQITVTQNAIYTAQFTPNTYTITTNVDPTGAGTVTGDGIYTYGQTATLTATANSHRHFDHWEDGSTQNPRQITVTSNATYTAYFVYDQHTITVNADPEDGGTVTGGGTYNYNTQITLEAIESPGYQFSHWQDDNTQNPRQITVTGDATYTADFNQINYQIQVLADPVNGGTVTGGGAFHYGDTPTLYATANSGYTFQGWNDGNTEPVRQITVMGNATYTAFFAQQGTTTYNVTATVSPVGAGTVSGTGVYQPGAHATLAASANTGYSFDHWQDGNTQNPRTVTVNSNLQFTAYFTQNTYTINTNVNPAGSGTVTGGGNNFHYGDQTTLTATAYNGYEFDRWNDGITQNPRQITVTGNTTYTAHFEQVAAPEYTITVNADPTDGGEVTGGGTYPEGTEVILTATPQPGYAFDRWNDNVTENPRTITVTGNVTYTAAFTPILYTITVVANPEEGGEVEGGGHYMYGDTCTVKATANPGFTFIDWKDDDGTIAFTESVYSFVVTDNRTLTANFAGEDQHIIYVEIDPPAGGTATGAGAYNNGDECTLKAFAKLGYHFVNWTMNGEVVSEFPTYTFTVIETAQYVAHFEQNMYTITVTVDPVNGGMVTGGGQYYYGAICTLTATPNPGFAFDSWMDDNNIITTTSPTYMFQVMSDVSYTANFSGQAIYTISATSGPNGSITPEGDIFVDQGNDQTFTMTPDPGCSIASVLIDGEDIGVTGPFTFSYTFINVTRDHTISVSFNGTGIEEAQALNVSIYPNPAKDKVYVEGGGIETLVLFDMLGNCLRNIDYDTSHELNVSDLPKGVYVLKLTTQDGRIGYQKLMLR